MQFRKIIVVLALLVLAVCSVMAQGQGRGRGPNNSPLGLTSREDVQADLALTDDQKTKLTELRDQIGQEARQAFQDAGQDQDARQKAMAAINAKSTEALGKILTPDQMKRLKEIRVQVMGNAIVMDKDMQTELGLTDEQKTKIADLQKTQQEANASLRTKQQAGEIQPEEARAGRAKNQQALLDGIDKVLTDDQKGKLKTMGGKPFVAKPPAGGGGGL